MSGSLWRGGAPLLLASASPARRQLLESAGLPVEVEPAGIDERALEAEARGADPAALALRLALAKTEAVAARHPGRVVVGADQVLDLDGVAVSKAPDEAAALRQLGALSGRSHVLHAAVAVARDGEVAEWVLDSATLAMRPLDAAALARYAAAAGDATTRSVGGYEIEGLGAHLFESVEGAHATILGLPLLPVLAALRRMDLLAF